MAQIHNLKGFEVRISKNFDVLASNLIWKLYTKFLAWWGGRITLMMMMMMMMMMMKNCFCGMVDRRKVFSLISSRELCQRSSPSWMSNTPEAGFEPAQNLSSSFSFCICACFISVKQALNILTKIIFMDGQCHKSCL